MDGVTLQLNLPGYGKYEPAELKRLLTKIAMSLISEEEVESSASPIPCTYTTEEVKALTIQRGRNIKSGRAKLLSHDEVMNEMTQLINTYED